MFQMFQSPKFFFLLEQMILLMLAAIFTSYALTLSFDYGRLSTVPNYDDCVYLHKAALYLQTLETRGILALFEQIQSHGLHSPFSIAWASIAYTFISTEDWSPYALNGLLIFLLLNLLNYILRRQSLPLRVFILTAFLLLPFCFLTVVEFRPDLLWGILCGFACVWAVSEPDVWLSLRKTTLLCLIFTAALLVKPTIFLITMAMAGYTLTASVMLRRQVSGYWPDHNDIQRFLIACLIALATCLPYILFFGADIWHYFWENQFGANRSVWLFKGNLWENQLYYIWGTGHRNNLRTPGNIIVISALISLVLVWRVSKTAEHQKNLWLLGTPLPALLACNLSGMKSAYLGAAFYASILFIAAYLLGRLPQSNLLPRSLVLKKHSFICLLSISPLLLLPLQKLPSQSRWLNEHRLSFSEPTQSMTRQFLALPEQNLGLVLFIQSGPVVPEAVAIKLIQQGRQVNYSSLAFKTSMEDIQISLQNAQFIVVQPLGLEGETPGLPAAGLQASLLQYLNHSETWEISFRVPIDHHSAISVFKQQTNTNLQKTIR